MVDGKNSKSLEQPLSNQRREISPKQRRMNGATKAADFTCST